MHKLVLLRHGQSSWNKENRFTGWVDVPLSAAGEAEAHAGGKLLKEGIDFSSEEETLNHLCASRGQTVVQVWPKLRRSGVFSDRFVKYVDGLVSK